MADVHAEVEREKAQKSRLAEQLTVANEHIQHLKEEVRYCFAFVFVALQIASFLRNNSCLIKI